MSGVTPGDIVEYWFGGDEREKYRTKWFPSGSIDAEVRADKEVTRLFGHALEEALAGRLDGWRQVGDDLTPIVALIVVVDQFSRHVYRLRDLLPEAPERARADALGLQLSEELMSHPGWEVRLSMSQLVFCLMPLRHSANVERLGRVAEIIERRQAQHEWNTELLERFRKQTTRRLQHLQDRARAEADDEILERAAFAADEGDILKHPLVQTVRTFLGEHNVIAGKDAAECPAVVISLSGGVDSMVICKILCVLSGLSSVQAVHIDYANRPESGREADFVQRWCGQLGVAFHKRVVDEVTRGVTDRALYEKVSRDARYDCYKAVLNNSGARGIIFGHHQGDVQENVISNVMHGCSPLQLSGMGPVGLSNGVTVWRPLLGHSKSDIFAFAHRYGVPYFKDTTPSWSTRGKLRGQLVPLLLDMYGQGCLARLSSLAAESDATYELLEGSIFGPFLRSVARHPCGLAVDVLPYRAQPVSFWREALRRLMHSLSMSMIRGRAVETFVERLQGRPAAGTAPALEWGPPGWVELRKGFDVELGADGVLVVLLEKVLSETEPRPDRVPLDRSAACCSHQLGCWTINIRWLHGQEGAAAAEVKALPRVRDVLPGKFHYVLAVPPRCRELVLASTLCGGRKKRAPPPPTLAGLDLRLRGGLPILIVGDAHEIREQGEEEDAEDEEGEEKNYALLEYRFVPQ